MPALSADWASLAAELAGALHLATPPVAITFHAEPPAGIAPFGRPMPDPEPDGRAGRVPAGCVFWIHGGESTFATVPEDHGNCSVGSLTHGMVTMDDVAGNADVVALLEAGWVTPEAMAAIPVVGERPGAVTYGLLAET
ncbi:MAG: hypothetical protein ACRD0D_01995, partial [Acidimicrobiales bacterium]